MWVTRCRNEVGASKIFVQVSAADAAELWHHPYPARFYVRHWDLLQADVFLSVEADCVHERHVIVLFVCRCFQSSEDAVRWCSR